MYQVIGIDDAGSLDAAAAALDRGELVVIPTDTVYGLAARAADAAAVAKIFAAKARTDAKAIAVLVADPAQARALVAEPVPEAFDALAAAHWPGALTLVAARRDGVTLGLGGDAATIGIRCPNDAWVRALATLVGALATTSANRSGEPTPSELAAITALFGDAVACYVDGGPRAGVASTVVDVTQQPPQLVRAGPIELVAFPHARRDRL